MIVNKDVKRAAERRAKLPKWARDEMDRLERELTEARRVAAQARGEKVTRVQVCPRTHSNEDRADYYAPDHADVRFMLGDDWQDHIDVQIDDHPRYGPSILVRGGHTGINVRPASGNVVFITLEK